MNFASDITCPALNLYLTKLISNTFYENLLEILSHLDLLIVVIQECGWLPLLP